MRGGPAHGCHLIRLEWLQVGASANEAEQTGEDYYTKLAHSQPIPRTRKIHFATVASIMSQSHDATRGPSIIANMSSDFPRSKRLRADSALTLAAGIALPSRASAVPTLTYTNNNPNSDSQIQPGLFQDNQWQDIFIPVSIEHAPLNRDENPSATSRKRRKITFSALHPSRTRALWRHHSPMDMCFHDPLTRFQHGHPPSARLATQNGSEPTSPSSAPMSYNYQHAYAPPSS
jgi:hypothetical protein